MKASFFWRGIQQSDLVIEMVIQTNFKGLERMEVLITSHMKVFLVNKYNSYIYSVQNVKVTSIYLWIVYEKTVMKRRFYLEEPTRDLVTVISSLWTRCSIRKIYMRTFALMWHPPPPVWICLNLDGSHPFLLSANVIIEWPLTTSLSSFPVDTGRKLTVQKTFNLCPVSTGLIPLKENFHGKRQWKNRTLW